MSSFRIGKFQGTVHTESPTNGDKTVFCQPVFELIKKCVDTQLP